MKFLFIVFLAGITQPDRDKVQSKLKAQLHDATEIRAASLVVWEEIADPAVKVRVLSIDVTGKNLPISKADFVAWKQANLADPSKVRVFAGETNQRLKDADLRRVE